MLKFKFKDFDEESRSCFPIKIKESSGRIVVVPSVEELPLTEFIVLSTHIFGETAVSSKSTAP